MARYKLPLPIQTMPKINELLPKEELEEMSRRERKKQETRWRIYEAAMALFAKKDFSSVKVEEICEEADVSNAAFFHHFTSKASLVRASLEAMKADIGQKLEAAEGASSIEKLELINREVSRSSQASASFAAQMFNAVTSDDARLDMRPDTGIINTLSDIIRTGQKNGEFSKSIPAEVAALSLTATWLTLPQAMQSSAFPKKPHDKLLKLILGGLKK